MNIFVVVVAFFHNLYYFRGTCNLAHLEEEKTHRISVDLEDDAGVIDLFLTITVTTALQEATSDGDSSANIALDVIPARLTDAEIQHYVYMNKKQKRNICIYIILCFLEIFFNTSFIKSNI